MSLWRVWALRPHQRRLVHDRGHHDQRYVTNKPYLGATVGTMTEQMAAQYRYDITSGVFIYSVEEGGAADKAGLRMGDVITKVGDTEVNTMEDLTRARSSTPPEIRSP